MLRRALESLTEQGRQKLEFGEGPVEGTMENSIVFQLGKQRAMCKSAVKVEIDWPSPRMKPTNFESAKSQTRLSATCLPETK